MNLLKGKTLEWFILVSIILLLSFGAHERNVIWGSDVALWQDCIQKSPRKERPYHNLGFAFYELKRWDEAQRSFEEALLRNSRYALSMYNLGLVFYQKGAMEEAVDRFQKAIVLDSTFPESYYNLGLAYYQEGLHQEAVEAYQTFLALKPDYENGYLSLALAYEKMEETDLAIEALDEELRRHPDNVEARVHLGDLFMERKEGSKALVHYRQALTHLDGAEAQRIKEAILAVEAATDRRGGKEGPWLR